ncbi:MAG: hypothetical protein KGJ35_03390 [Patescibacteria group bacterium]|nr:hypothetical protein [Patescibacteria group bacterium]
MKPEIWITLIGLVAVIFVVGYASYFQRRFFSHTRKRRQAADKLRISLERLFDENGCTREQGAIYIKQAEDLVGYYDEEILREAGYDGTLEQLERELDAAVHRHEKWEMVLRGSSAHLIHDFLPKH